MLYHFVVTKRVQVMDESTNGELQEILSSKVSYPLQI